MNELEILSTLSLSLSHRLISFLNLIYEFDYEHRYGVLSKLSGKWMHTSSNNNLFGWSVTMHSLLTTLFSRSRIPRLVYAHKPHSWRAISLLNVNHLESLWFLVIVSTHPQASTSTYMHTQRHTSMHLSKHQAETVWVCVREWKSRTEYWRISKYMHSNNNNK